MRAQSAPPSIAGCRTSAVVSSEAQYRNLAPQIDTQAVGAESERGDENPGWHCQPEEGPRHLGAFSGAGQHLDQHLAQGKYLEHEIERRPAGRDAALREAL